MFVFKTYNIDRAVLREYNLSAFGQEKENGMNILYAKIRRIYVRGWKSMFKSEQVLREQLKIVRFCTVELNLDITPQPLCRLKSRLRKIEFVKSQKSPHL